jgi:hypothetical protein
MSIQRVKYTFSVYTSEGIYIHTTLPGEKGSLNLSRNTGEIRAFVGRFEKQLSALLTR